MLFPLLVDNIQRDHFLHRVNDLVVVRLNRLLEVDNNADLFNILRSINAGRNSDNQFNPKRISFLEGHPVKNPSAPKSGFLDSHVAG